MTCANEILDLPHHFFGDRPTSFGQRAGEIYIELFIFALVILVEVLLMRSFYKRIRILEGFLPICANCKKIRHRDQWDQIENYITAHSLAKFSHSLCPDCARALYPELNDTKKKRPK
jgi:hypothetical protein